MENRIISDKMRELSGRKVYQLIGEDVFNTLEDMGLEEMMEDEEEMEKLIDYISRKMEIPWSEYVEASIDIFIERKKWD